MESMEFFSIAYVGVILYLILLIFKTKTTINLIVVLSIGTMLVIEGYILYNYKDKINLSKIQEDLLKGIVALVLTLLEDFKAIAGLLVLVVLIFLYQTKRYQINSAIETYSMATTFIRGNYYILLVPISASISMMMLLLLFQYYYDRSNTNPGDLVINKTKSFYMIPAIFFFNQTTNMIVSFCSTRWYFSRNNSNSRGSYSVWEGVSMVFKKNFGSIVFMGFIKAVLMYLDIFLMVFEMFFWFIGKVGKACCFILLIPCLCCCYVNCCCGCCFTNGGTCKSWRKSISDYLERLNMHTICHIAMYGSSFSEAYNSSKVVARKNIVKTIFIKG